MRRQIKGSDIQYIKKTGMLVSKNYLRILVIAIIICSVLLLHYAIFSKLAFHPAIYRMLFFVPLVFGSLWFGLKGAMVVAISVSVLFLPYGIIYWKGFNFEDISRILEGVLYFIIALLLGFLVEKERKRHRELLRAESLAAVGNAVSEIAHDMKTPLIAIGGLARQISKKLSNDERNKRKLDCIIKEASRLEAMVKEMLDFGSPIALQREMADINRLIEESVDVVKPMAIRAGVELVVELRKPLPLISLDPGKMEQVVLNLVSNAIQASSAGQHVAINTRTGEECLIVEITDSGCGIDDAITANIFDPFFSTKSQGTGLGLAIVRKIVLSHGGRVYLNANVKKGTSFIVEIPMVKESNIIVER